jgi:hypothetical protein
MVSNRRHSSKEDKKNLRVLGKGQNLVTIGNTRSHNNGTPNHNFGKDGYVVDITRHKTHCDNTVKEQNRVSSECSNSRGHAQ